MFSTRAHIRRVPAVKVRADAAPAADAPAPVRTEKTGPNFTALRDINQIMQTLPHRSVNKHNSPPVCVQQAGLSYFDASVSVSLPADLTRSHA